MVDNNLKQWLTKFVNDSEFYGIGWGFFCALFSVWVFLKLIDCK